ncbi:MAG: sugar ABC transporter ATP-binding protein [Planctomycetaceae bacterium]|nr:sugar ABC transporter ATP-binding protein [Planctomycetaceae bacterium]
MYALEAVGVSKSFAGVRALKNVSLQVKKGAIHALIGENGAGKSTLMRIVAGAETKDAGEIRLDGRAVDIQSPRDAIDRGVAIIYQEYVLAPDLTVAENIFIDRLAGGKGFIHWRDLNAKAAELLARLGFTDIRPDDRVGDLKVAYQQVVEICKALSRDSKVLILDEPTAVLTFREKEKLFGLLRDLQTQGVTIVYISHRLEELFELCSDITVFKDGEYVDTVSVAGSTIDRLINMMVGRELSNLFPTRHATIGETVLEVHNLRRAPVVNDVSFTVRAGEVLGFSGLVGAGRTETMRLIYGADRMDAGEIVLNGKRLAIRSTTDAIRAGIGFLPEDRKRQGIILEMPIRINATLASMRQVTTRFHTISRKREKELVDRLVRFLSIKLGSMEDDVSTLSGGNQQKVSFAKWIAANCKCIILDEPTRGVDVGAKVEIYQIINEMAEKGMAVVVVSSEMLELIGICDRVLVMRGGSVMGELAKDDLTENNMISLAMGVQG